MRHLGILCIPWLGLQAFDLASQWPNLIAYYNTASGGQAEGYRHFRDSNSDWGQLRAKGRSMLQASAGEDLEFIGPGQGPRFGRVAIYLSSLVSKDPEDSTRTRHWLDAFKPAQHVGAAWWVFDCRPEAWEAAPALATKQRVRADLVVAYLGDGRLDEAGRHLDLLAADRAAPLLDLLDLLRSAKATEPSDQQALAIVQHWMRVGRFDHATELLRRHGNSQTRGILAQALSNGGRDQEAITLLEGASAKNAGEVLSLATLYQRTSRNREAVELLEQHIVEFSAPERDLAERLLTSARSLADFRKLIR